MTMERALPSSLHTFCVAAYGESPYLDACLQSLANQTVRARIALCTSTPTPHLQALAAKYGAQYHVATHTPGLGRDWNFAYRCADTPYVTIAHQDDLYEPGYLTAVLSALANTPDALMLFTDYRQRIRDKPQAWRMVVAIKRLLVFPFWFRPAIRSPAWRKLVFRFGNPVSCPGVVLHKTALPADFAFDETLKTNIDWMAWIALSQLPGSFYRVPQCLVQHRIHAASTTSDTLQSHDRQREDRLVFEQLWGPTLARAILFFYRLSYWLNDVSSR